MTAENKDKPGKVGGVVATPGSLLAQSFLLEIHASPEISDRTKERVFKQVMDWRKELGKSEKTPSGSET
ncbi:hypothetical protein IPM62_05605 [Candidatus Woesebacteria bacterium]|nr:MAG: hypothetical protein IPM62_05605 [Candidatus Woesebacteria bacterium]